MLVDTQRSRLVRHRPLQDRGLDHASGDDRRAPQLGCVQDAALDRQHLAGRVADGLGWIPDAPPVPAPQHRRHLHPLDRVQTHHLRIGEHGVGEPFGPLAHQRRVGPVETPGDRLDDVAARERRPLGRELRRDHLSEARRRHRRGGQRRPPPRAESVAHHRRRLGTKASDLGRPARIQAPVVKTLVVFGRPRRQHRQPIDTPALFGLQRPAERSLELGNLGFGCCFDLGGARAEAGQ